MANRAVRLRLTASLLAAFAFGAACTANGATPARQVSQLEPQATSDAHSRQNNDGTLKSAGTGKPAHGSTFGRPDRDPSRTTKNDAGPRPLKLPWKSEVRVDATVDPTCVVPGQSITLTVRTEPEAGVVYQAVYADNKGGAPKPLGGGYGGNDKGYSDANGNWTSTWVVSLDAPEGPARVDVIVGWHAEWGYDDPTFAVAASKTGSCTP